MSKLAATGWVRERAWIDGLDDVTDDACYRAMDWLLEIEEQLCERVYWQTADLLNLEAACSIAVTVHSPIWLTNPTTMALNV